MPDVRHVWDQPDLGMTAADFTKWPGKHRLRRSDGHADLLNAAYEQGALTFPVYVVGECTTYDIAHGHPSFGGAKHDNTFFVVSGTPGDPWPRITHMRSKGVFSRRIEAVMFPEYDQLDLATVELFPAIGYVDLQLSSGGVPVGRIGFGYFKDSPAVAHQQAQAVMQGILKCREGRLPNQ